MIHAQDSKWVLSVLPVIHDDTSMVFLELDTKTWDYLEVVLAIGITDDAIETAMLLTESDTAGSGHVTISGTVWTTALDIAGDATVYPTAADDGKLYKWEVNLKGRKRYIDATITVADATLGVNACVMSRLSRGEVAPTTAAEAGFAAIVRV